MMSSEAFSNEDQLFGSRLDTEADMDCCDEDGKMENRGQTKKIDELIPFDSVDFVNNEMDAT